MSTNSGWRTSPMCDCRKSSRSEEAVRGHHGFPARLPGVSEPSQKPGVERCQPTLGGGHHLCAIAGRVRDRKKRFVATTDSQHDFLVYPNLAKNLVLSDVNQLWVADITYVRLQEEFEIGRSGSWLPRIPSTTSWCIRT